MKAIHAFLLLIFIHMNICNTVGFTEKSCSEYQPGGKPAYSYDFCRSTKWEDKYARCCFVKLELNEQRLYHCYGLSNEEWYDIDVAKTNLENKNYEVNLIECSSSYLYSSLLLLLILLF